MRSLLKSWWFIVRDWELIDCRHFESFHFALFIYLDYIQWTKKGEYDAIMRCTLLQNWHHVYRFVFSLTLLLSPTPPASEPLLRATKNTTVARDSIQLPCQNDVKWDWCNLVRRAPRAFLSRLKFATYTRCPRSPERYFICNSFDQCSRSISVYTMRRKERISINLWATKDYSLQMYNSRSASRWHFFLIFTKHIALIKL